jgi:hypothetical protein
MASLFEYDIDLDLGNALKNIKDFSKKTTSEINDIIKANTKLQKSFNDVKVPTQEVEELGKTYQKTSDTAKSAIDAQKKALAQLIITGKKG